MADNIPQQKLALVCSTFLFEQVDEIVVEQIVADQRCFCQRFARRTVIGEAYSRNCLGILLAGEVREEQVVPDGKRIMYAMLQPGMCFGVAALFRKWEPYELKLTVQGNAEVLFLPEEVIRWAMRRNYTITENYIRYLSDQIGILHEKIAGLTAGTADRRLAVFLLSHCQQDGIFRMSMTELSRQIHMGRATLYRALGTLEEQQLIIRENKRLRVVDLEGLQQMAQRK